jgi:hypothetical protein
MYSALGYLKFRLLTVLIGKTKTKSRMIAVRLWILCIITGIAVQTTAQDSTGYKTIYQPVNDGIMGVNTGRYNNRPLYVNNSDAFVLTGDKPLSRFAQGEFYYGTFSLEFERGGRKKVLHHFSQDTSVYFPGKMLWILSDTSFPDLRLELQVCTAAGTTGMTAMLQVINAKNGDRLNWLFGGARSLHETDAQFNNFSWTLDVMGHPEITNWEKDTIHIAGNYLHVEGKRAFIHLLDSMGRNRFVVSAECSAADKPIAKEMISGSLDLKANPKVYWIFRAAKEPDPEMINGIVSPRVFFSAAKQRNDLLNNRLTIQTPDKYFDAVAKATVAAIDGTWYPPVFHHGAMQWNMRFPGWRVLCGASVLGWHDRLKNEAAFYISSQITESDKKIPMADSSLLMTIQHPDSRFFGEGYINKDQNFYNMQSQFFDQLIDEYRMTNDPQLIKILAPALELHLQWIQDCFDPDNDGIYESYLNTWPTDSQWYNGGGTAEETSYAYKAHLAARDMALQSGNQKSAYYHSFIMEKIQKSFFKNLWIDSLGYSGSYREQGGHNRLHTNPWLYSIFLPIDANLVSREQAVASLYYTESDLQNDRMPAGGRTVWTSNWVPGIWSVRENWPGDNYALAQSYFQSGLADQAWDLMRGSFMHYAFDHLTPGNLGGVQGGVDFGDCMQPFIRAVVEGMFGFHPDFPNRKVILSPTLPTNWDHAKLDVPDYRMDFFRDSGQLNFNFKIRQPAMLEIYLPVRSGKIQSVTLNGNPVEWQWVPGYGEGIIQIKTLSMDKASVVIETGKTVTYHPPQELAVQTGDDFRVEVDADSVLDISDPQHVFKEWQIREKTIHAILNDNPGNHSFFVRVNEGDAPQWRVFHVHVRNMQREETEKEKYTSEIPPGIHWKKIRIDSLYNADLSKIYQQKYLSPRPNTVSARLGTDGYSAWTFPYWKIRPPEIKTDSVKYLLQTKNELKTKQGIPFYWNDKTRNITFTSLWDNFPSAVSFPVNDSGKVCYFLICGSTNVMQCQIANAFLKLTYASGDVDTLALIPPVNYWNLSSISGNGGGPGQTSSNDYLSPRDKFCMPEKLPETVGLGQNCRAMLLNLKMRPGLELKSVTLETVSQEVVVGLMGITIAD